MYFFDYNIQLVHEKLFWARLEIFDNIAKLLTDLKTENIHQLFYIYCYLLWNGFFSVDKKYVYNNKDVVDEENAIFLGKGCCRHNSKHLTTILKKMKFDVYDMRVRTGNIKFRPIIDIDAKTEIYESNTNFSKRDFDHSVVLNISEENGNFILDPTMMIELEMIRHSKLVCFHGIYKVRKKLFQQELNTILSKDCLYHSKPFVHLDILLENYRNAEEICQENIRLFDDFFDDNHKHYEQIKKLLIKIR